MNRVGVLSMLAVACWVAVVLTPLARATDLVIQSFEGPGQLTFNALADGTNYNYRVEWSPSPSGPWSTFGGGGTWLDTILPNPGSSVTSTVPMFYRVVATRGDYLVVDLSAGPGATKYPLRAYRTLADVPGGADSDAYKTTNLLLRLIPKGTFTMGCPTGELWQAFDETEHQVTLTQDYYIGVYEVTQRQWERVMGTWPSFFTNATCRDSRPVEWVSYDAIRGSGAGAGWPANGHVDADSFLGRLRSLTGWLFDLPTESQWEYAARAGTTTALNSGYNLTSTTNDPEMSKVGRYRFNGGFTYLRDVDTSAGTAKVGSYRSNAWGLYDMHGNSFEWCLDWYGTYPDTVSDPEGAVAGSYRTLRGGSWGYDAYLCRSARREGGMLPAYAWSSFGFRVCLPMGQ